MNGPTRVLLVDDERAFTRAMKLNLEDTSLYDVTVVNDSKIAVDAALRCRPDVILLDLMMPEVDGPDVAASMRENAQLSGVPVIFLTALVRKSEEKHLQRGQTPGRYLAKPVTTAEVGRAIAEVLRP